MARKTLSEQRADAIWESRTDCTWWHPVERWPTYHFSDIAERDSDKNTRRAPGDDKVPCQSTTLSLVAGYFITYLSDGWTLSHMQSPQNSSLWTTLTYFSSGTSLAKSRDGSFWWVKENVPAHCRLFFQRLHIWTSHLLRSQSEQSKMFLLIMAFWRRLFPTTGRSSYHINSNSLLTDAISNTLRAALIILKRTERLKELYAQLKDCGVKKQTKTKPCWLTEQHLWSTGFPFSAAYGQMYPDHFTTLLPRNREKKWGNKKTSGD